MKRLIFALLVLLLPAMALAEANPRSVFINESASSVTVFVGAVRATGLSVVVEPATWVTIVTDGAMNVQFNLGGYLEGAAGAARSGISATYNVSTIIPLAAAGTYVFSCSATLLSFTDAADDDITVIAEYRKGT